MDARKIVFALGLVAIAVVIARRAQAGVNARALAALGPVPQPELGPIRIDAPRLVIAPARQVTAPPPAGAQLAQFFEGAVDQITDALKGLGLWSKKVPEKYRALFAMTGAQYRLPPGLLEAVAYRESRFRADIIRGEVKSAAGAVGIMQIVPRWHPELGLAGALDPLRAVPYAARYLRALFERFGTWKKALAAYNWGPTNLSASLAAGKLPDTWPSETRLYVAEITANAGLA